MFFHTQFICMLIEVKSQQLRNLPIPELHITMKSIFVYKIWDFVGYFGEFS